MSTDQELIFEKRYYNGGGASNYDDYMQKKHDALAKDLTKHFGFKKTDTIIDFGSATGGLVLELLNLGLNEVYGTDISYWAVTKAQENPLLTKRIHHYNLQLVANPKDYVLSLDVLEHVPTQEELERILSIFGNGLSKACIVRIPVAEKEGENFYLEVSRNDKTHYQCHSKDWWINMFESQNFKLKEQLELPSIYTSTGVLSAVFEPKYE